MDRLENENYDKIESKIQQKKQQILDYETVQVNLDNMIKEWGSLNRVMNMIFNCIKKNHSIADKFDKFLKSRETRLGLINSMLSLDWLFLYLSHMLGGPPILINLINDFDDQTITLVEIKEKCQEFIDDKIQLELFFTQFIWARNKFIKILIKHGVPTSSTRELISKALTEDKDTCKQIQKILQIHDVSKILNLIKTGKFNEIESLVDKLKLEYEERVITDKNKSKNKIESEKVRYQTGTNQRGGLDKSTKIKYKTDLKKSDYRYKKKLSKYDSITGRNFDRSKKKLSSKETLTDDFFEKLKTNDSQMNKSYDSKDKDEFDHSTYKENSDIINFNELDEYSQNDNEELQNDIDEFLNDTYSPNQYDNLKNENIKNTDKTNLKVNKINEKKKSFDTISKNIKKKKYIDTIDKKITKKKNISTFDAKLDKKNIIDKLNEEVKERKSDDTIEEIIEERKTTITIDEKTDTKTYSDTFDEKLKKKKDSDTFNLNIKKKYNDSVSTIGELQPKKLKTLVQSKQALIYRDSFDENKTDLLKNGNRDNDKVSKVGYGVTKNNNKI